MEKNIFSIKIQNSNDILKIPNNNGTRLIKKVEPKIINKRNKQEMKIKKFNSPKFSAQSKILSPLHTPPNTNKIFVKNRILNSTHNLSSLNNSNNNSLRNSKNNGLKFFVKNNNSNNNCISYINKTLENIYSKNNQNNNNSNNLGPKGNDNTLPMENNHLKLELNKDKKEINNNLKTLLDIMKSNKYIYKDNNNNINMNENNINNSPIINNLINNDKIVYRKKDNKIEYSNTEAANAINANKDNHNYLFSEINICDIKNSKGSTIKDLFTKKNVSRKKLKKNTFKVMYTSDNEKFINKSKEHNLSNNEINNSYIIRNSYIRNLSEIKKQTKDTNRITTHESFKKINNYYYKNKKIKELNDGDYNLKKKIKNSLDQLKKNKELSQQLNATEKELDKLYHLREKYISAIYENIEIQKEYNTLVKNNEENLKEIEFQNKKLIEKENIINDLSKQINSKNIFIKQKDEQIKNILIQKDEILNKLNNTIENLKEKLYQTQKENIILYKFKELYNENASKNIELENSMILFKDINNKYISLQKDFDELEDKYKNLNDIENKYNILIKENSLLREMEKQYKDITFKYNDLEENYNKLKEMKNNYEKILIENKDLKEIRKKYDKIYPEYINLKEIREKYGNILKEQKDLIIIENKYNDLLQEIKELKDYKNKYDDLLEEKNKEINEYN